MTWPISNHESPDVDLLIPGLTAPHYLWAILKADGEQFRPTDDYAKVREYLAQAVDAFSHRPSQAQRPTAAVSAQRLRTWKAAFEEMGLLTVDEDGAVQATRFGRAVVEGFDLVGDALDGANRHIARLGAQVANRVFLAKPDGTGRPAAGVPADADIFPLRVIWRAFRHLGDRLHWQDVNRVLGHLNYDRDVPAGLDAIASFRSRFGDHYPADAATLNQLGADSLTDDPRHITPWFNRAGIGGMLIPSEMNAGGFRVLSAEAVTLIDGLLAETPPPLPPAARTNREQYIRYLMEPVERAQRPEVGPADHDVVEQVLDAVRRFGKSKLIVLSGLPGTGKSRLARIVADQLTDGDPLRLKDIQFHESTAYEDFMDGFVPRPDGQGFERRRKTLRIINQRALDDPGKVHVLLIEEFTRANVHAVLGELITFIEHRGRKFTLSLSQEEIAISPDLVVIATMNPRDRSALTLDDAVTRRMHRVSIGASASALRTMLEGQLDPAHLGALCSWFTTHLAVLPFGHGVFAGANDLPQLQQIWSGTVVPLLSDPLGRVLDAYRPAFDAFPFAGTGA